MMAEIFLLRLKISISRQLLMLKGQLQQLNFRRLSLELNLQASTLKLKREFNKTKDLSNRTYKREKTN